MDLKNLQYERNKVCKDFRFPIEVETGHENSQWERTKLYKDFKFPIKARIDMKSLKTLNCQLKSEALH